MLTRIGFVILAYTIGSIPFGYLLVKYIFTGGEDIREVGSGGIGATNVTRRAGRKAGLLTYFCDVGKGVAAVMLMRMVAPDDYFWVGAAAVAVILGHVFPVFLGFKGGKGVATGVGVYLALAPISVLSTLLLWGLIVYVSRYVSLGSILATAAVPFWTLLYYGYLWPSPHLEALVVIAFIGCGIIVATHWANIRRLIKGTENRIGKRVGPQQGESSPVAGRGNR